MNQDHQKEVLVSVEKGLTDLSVKNKSQKFLVFQKFLFLIFLGKTLLFYLKEEGSFERSSSKTDFFLLKKMSLFFYTLFIGCCSFGLFLIFLISSAWMISIFSFFVFLGSVYSFHQAWGQLTEQRYQFFSDYRRLQGLWFNRRAKIIWFLSFSILTFGLYLIGFWSVWITLISSLGESVSDVFGILILIFSILPLFAIGSSTFYFTKLFCRSFNGFLKLK